MYVSSQSSRIMANPIEIRPMIETHNQARQGYSIMSQSFSCNRRQALRISGGAAGVAASLAILPTSGATGLAQDDQAKVATAAAKPQDVESIEAIIAAVYGVISGPKGDREWDRMRSLFPPRRS